MEQADNYNILVVDPHDSTRDSILSSFSNEDVPALIAEAKSLKRAVTYIEESNLHYLFLGPNLERLDVKEFLSINDSGAKIPTIVLLPRELLQEANDFLNEGANAAIPFPIVKGEILNTIKKAASKTFGTHVTITPEKPEPAQAQAHGRAHELANVLSKLSIRLEAVASRLKAMPQSTDIDSMSIPEAVNEVITKSSLLRKGKENEDLDLLVKNITR